MAPLSAALANGDDTLSITADAAITAALLAYYTSSQVDTLLGDYRTGTAQDAETTSAITAALLAYYTAAQVDALLGDYRTASAQDTQTQAAIAGALLAYRTGPDQDVFTTNQITSALVAYRSAADQDTATASSIAAALLSYYTIAQVDGLLAGKLGVTEAASALQIAVRFPDDGGADEVVAAIGEQILGPTDVSLSNWTVRPSSGCSVVLATHTAGVSVDGYTLTLAANPWNIVRTYNLTPGRELLFACRYRLGTASNFVVYMSEADNVYDPLYGSFAGRAPGARPRCTSQCRPTELRSCTSGRTSRRRACPTRRPERWTSAASRSWTQPWRPATRRRRTLKHEFLDGGADDVTLATLGEVLLEPTLTTLGNFLVRSNSQSSVASASFAVGGFQLEGYAMTLSAFAWNIVLEAKSCGAETVSELVTSPHTTLPVDTPPLVAVKVQSRLSQSSGPAEAAPVIVSVAPVSAPVAAKLAAVAAPEAVSVPVDTSPAVVKFPALAVLLMVSVLPVIPVAELSRPTLAAPLMLSELPHTAPWTTARPRRRCRWL